jgi:DNA-binding NtrC family response regulator
MLESPTAIDTRTASERAVRPSLRPALLSGLPRDSVPMLAAGLALRVVKGVNLNSARELGSSVITVGSAASNDLCLGDRHISRFHCEVFARDGDYWIRDLGSTNGTFVDGERISEARLTRASRLVLGMSELALEKLSEPQNESCGAMVGNSATMRQVFAALRSVAQSSLTCLLLGETGSGKELAARALHEHSPRASKPFLVVDCASVGAQFIEDKLFGHERGAFTGAHGAQPGVFEEARGGTVFLDEIGELPVALQAKLLGVLERREATRIGSHTPIKLDVRLVAATHRNPAEMAQRGEFRQDLLYRLSEFTLRIPALRERREDIPAIALAVLSRDGHERSLTNDAISYLQERRWPGNIRELRNLMRRAAVLAQSTLIDGAVLRSLEEATSVIEITGLRSQAPTREQRAAAKTPEALASSDAFDLPLGEATESFRKHYVAQLRQRFGNDLNAAAQHAGVHPKSISRLFRMYDVY